jgi:hypothetical protein
VSVPTNKKVRYLNILDDFMGKENFYQKIPEAKKTPDNL